MAKERYINADELLSRLRAMPIPYINTYSSSQIDSALRQMISIEITNCFSQFRDNIAMAIDTSATLDGPCFLCKQRDGGPDLPLNIHRA